MGNPSVQEQRARFAALLQRLGPPDRAAARQFLARREPAAPADEETKALITKVQARMTATRQSAPPSGR